MFYFKLILFLCLLPVCLFIVWFIFCQIGIFVTDLCFYKSDYEKTKIESSYKKDCKCKSCSGGMK
jgi:hypothetical protein